MKYARYTAPPPCPALGFEKTSTFCSPTEKKKQKRQRTPRALRTTAGRTWNPTQREPHTAGPLHPGSRAKRTCFEGTVCKIEEARTAFRGPGVLSLAGVGTASPSLHWPPAPPGHPDGRAARALGRRRQAHGGPGEGWSGAGCHVPDSQPDPDIQFEGAVISHAPDLFFNVKTSLWWSEGQLLCVPLSHQHLGALGASQGWWKLAGSAGQPPRGSHVRTVTDPGTGRSLPPPPASPSPAGNPPHPGSSQIP